MKISNDNLTIMGQTNAMRSFGTIAMVAAAATMFFAGCAGAPNSTSGPSIESTPTKTAVDSSYSFPMDCQNATIKATWTYDSFEALWTTPEPVLNCNAGAPEGNDFSIKQLAALDAAGYEHTTDALGFLYARCADLGTTDPPDGYWSSAYAALSLCPDHPDSAAIIARADAGTAVENAAAAEAAEQAALEQQTEDQRNAEIATGTRITAGIYRVGETVQPGVFVTEGDLENCYWERLAPDGTILENGFLMAALRVEVTIDPTDYSFSSQRCGEWIKIG